MKKITKLLSFILSIIFFGISLTGCLKNTPADSDVIKYQIITENINCSLSISKNEAKQNESITIVHSATSDIYELEKLYYLKGTIKNGTFTATDDTEYTISNNTFQMPSSAVKVVCKYKSIQKTATIKSVTLFTDSWGTTKRLDKVLIAIERQTYYSNENYNYTGITLSWDFTQTKNSYLISNKNNWITLTLSIGFTYIGSATSEIAGPDAFITQNLTSTGIKIDSYGFAEMDLPVSFNVHDITSDTIREETITFTLSVQFDIVEL